MLILTKKANACIIKILGGVTKIYNVKKTEKSWRGHLPTPGKQ